MKRISACAVGILLIVCGCSIVASKAPVGQVPVVVDEKGWNGTWYNPDGTYCVLQVRNEHEGILQLAWIENDKELKYQSGEVFIRKSGNVLFVSTKETQEKTGADVVYVWARIKKERNMILIWLPDEEKFRKLIEAHILPGEIKNGMTILGDLKPEHMKAITSEEKGLLFDWERPLVLIKVN